MMNASQCSKKHDVFALDGPTYHHFESPAAELHLASVLHFDHKQDTPRRLIYQRDGFG
jgi:hypothetical protein